MILKNIKSLFFSFLLLIYGENVDGQVNKFNLGVEGGPSLVFMRGNDLVNNLHKPTIGFSSGIFFQFNLKKIIAIRTNLSFERKGSVMNLPTVDKHGNIIGEATLHSNFEYLTLPVLARATFGKKIRFFVNAGPYFGVLMKQTAISQSSNFPETKIDETYLFKRFDFGVSTGIGFSIPIKAKFVISLEIRNNLGVYNISVGSISNNGAVRTNSTNFLLSFAYKFGQRTSESK